MAEKEQEDREEEEQQEKPDPMASLRSELADEFDKKLAARDAALLDGMKNMFGQLFQQGGEKREGQQEEKQPENKITNEDFWRDPTSALEQFHKTKIAPALDEVKRARESDVGDRTAMSTLVEVQKMKLKDAIGTEAWGKYQNHLNQVISKVDPRVIATDEGLDAVWRLTKSYADDAIASEERSRQERNLKANMERGGKNESVQSKKVELSDDERSMAEALGVAPESWKEYEAVKEVEIGSGRKKK